MLQHCLRGTHNAFRDLQPYGNHIVRYAIGNEACQANTVLNRDDAE